MLDKLFMQILDLTFRGSLVIICVLLVRLLLKKAPKIYSYLLWSVVLFRLLCPVSIQTPVSVMPEFEPVEQSYTLQDQPISAFSAGVAAYEAVGDALNGGLGVQHIYTQQTQESGMPVIVTAQWWEVWVLFGKYLWLAGMVGLAAYSIAVYLKLRYQLIGSAKLQGNIYLSDGIPSPFVLGLIRPKIYLPSFIGEHERSYILIHEQHHIRRLDHVVKLVAYIALMLHWFNPLVWLAYILFCKDMEMSCDEAVVQKMGPQIRADYAASLLNLATGHRIVTVMPLAFGEGDTKGRVKNMSRWKKPKLWICIIAVFVILGVGVILLTDPLDTPQEDPFKATYADPNPLIPEGIFDITQSWAGWTGEGLVWAGLNANKLQYSNIQHLPIMKFDTRQELDAFMERTGDYLTMNDSSQGVPSFYETAQKYSESFFKENTLMLVYIPSGNSGRTFRVSQIRCSGSYFVIHVEETPSAQIKEPKKSGWFITAAVPDSMIADCTDFDADITNLSQKAPQISGSRSEPDGSFFTVDVPLLVTDLSAVSQEAKQLIQKDWAAYDAMPEFNRMVSSRLWGCVYMYGDSWRQAMKDLNLDIKNPLENLSYLKKGNYMDGKDVAQGKQRVQTTLLATASSNRQLSQVSIRTGYTMEDVRITFRAIVWNEGGVYQTGGGHSEHATFQQGAALTVSGNEALLVQTDKIENYCSLDAYWVDGNVLYNIYLVGQPGQQEQLQKVMNKLLSEV